MFPVDSNTILTVSVWLCFAVWPAAIGWTLYCLARQPRLRPLPRRELRTSVSIVVPMRNEAGRIPVESIRSMIAQDYPDLEIIIVNDRSTDATGSILRSLAAESNRIRIVEGTETPVGWLGKPHALAQGVAAAKAEWILMTDADIVFHRSAVASALGSAMQTDLDAISLLPYQRLGGFWEKLFLPVFAWFCLLIRPLHRVNDARTATSFGSGNFFLIRRAALESVGGIAGIRNDVAEDLRLAGNLKRARHAFRTVYAPELIETRMYAGFAELWEGFSKNFFSGMKFSLIRTGIGAFWIIGLGAAPVVFGALAFAAGRPDVAGPLVGSFIAQIVLFVIVRIYYGSGVIYSLFAPLGFLMFAAILINSARRIVSGSGVEWKGRRIYESGGIVPPKN